MNTHNKYNIFDNEITNLDSEKYANYLAAIQNSSTFGYFTVIKVKNINSGVTKDICTKGGFVMGAIHQELKLDYDEIGMDKCFDFATSKKDKYFEFKDKKALDNISFFDYKIRLVDKVQIEYNFGKAIQSIKKDKNFAIRLPDDKMKAFAHVLFNEGYLTGESDCFGGTLQYVDRLKEGK